MTDPNEFQTFEVEAAPWYAQYAKAIWGALLAAAIAFLAALLPYLDGVGINGVPDYGWVVAILAALTALSTVGATVGAVANRQWQTPKRVQPYDGKHEAS